MRRYLDDIIAVQPIDTDFDAFGSFMQHCYPKPNISLEENPPTHYLEMEIHPTADGIHLKHWNKNAMHILALGTQRIIKHQHFDSYGPPRLKYGMVVGEFTRLSRHCTLPHHTMTAMAAKSMELTYLGYPKAFLRRAATHVANRLRDSAMMRWATHGFIWTPPNLFQNTTH